MDNAEEDRIDVMRRQWSAALPDLDTSSLEITGRVLGFATRIEAAAEAALADFNLGVGDFSVLVSLRRVAKTGGLSPGRITAETMVSAGATTQRLDRLEASGLIERRRDANDRRAQTIHLTPDGATTAEEAIATVTATERVLLSPLSAMERHSLAALLKDLNPDDRGAKHAKTAIKRPRSTPNGQT